jgi:mRNA interferase HigB
LIHSHTFGRSHHPQTSKEAGSCWHFANLLYLRRVNILKRQAIVDFYQSHADSRIPLETWFLTCKKANWENFNELQLDFPHAFPVGDNRVVFNIKGNKYRLVARVLFLYKQIQIKWIGTHGEYDKINVNKIDQYK